MRNRGNVVITLTRRDLGKAAAAVAVTGALLPSAHAQPAGQPIRIGLSQALSGGLAASGRAAQVVQRIWAADVNAAGGLLGRPVELVYYDDASNPAQVPGIYTKLLDIDKVDLVVSSYGTAIIAPAMPVVMQRNMAFVSLFGAGVNSEFHYDRYVNMSPGGSNLKETFAKGFLDIAGAMSPAPKTIALVCLDSDFPQRAAESARYLAQQRGMRVVYDRAYPPSTVDFAPIIRAVQAARPDAVFVGSYPPDSANLLRAASELRMNVPLFGGAMIGPQITAQKISLGPILNNLVGWNVYAPEPTLQFAGTRALIERYQAVAAKEGTDALGYYVPPLAYAQMQVMQQAVTRVGKLDQAAIGADFHNSAFDTVVGTLRFDTEGEWAEERNLWTQYQGVAGHDIEQFRKVGTEVVLYPPRFKSGELKGPYTSGA